MRFVLLLTLTFLTESQSFEWIKMQMVKRVNKQGKIVKQTATVVFSADGKMVSRYTYPFELVMVNNKEGELILYHPEKNEVFQSMNHMMGTENNHFYYFLAGTTDDMGLEKLGFKLNSSQLKDNLLVSYWTSPQLTKQGMKDVEVVHEGRRPIFLGYRNEKSGYLKKVYFYEYEDLNGIDFPKSMTEIDFFLQDSSVTKTTFSQFEFDNPADLEILNFEIPASATVVK